MNNKCDYLNFFNEFNLRIEKRLKLIPLYNGFYFPNNYKKHLQFTLEKFRHDILYELPFSNQANKKVFLTHLHQELRQKQMQLERHGENKAILSIKNTTKTQIPKRIVPILHHFHMRRNRYMYHRQAKTLNHALGTVLQAKESYGYYEQEAKSPEIHQTNPKIIPETTTESTPEMIWNGGKLGLIQLTKALIRSKAILIGQLTETQAIDQIAKLINIDLNKNNFSSLSRAIHSNNNDYIPQIFTSMIKAYELIAQERRESIEN